MHKYLIYVIVLASLVIVMLTVYKYCMVARNSCYSGVVFNDELCEAANMGNNLRIQNLLEKGASVDTRCNNSGKDYGKTILIIAIEKHHSETVKLLLNHGANPRMGDDFTDGGKSAIYYAVTVGDIESFKYINRYCEYAEQMQCIFDATVSNRIDIITYLLSCGINPLISDPNGHIPLHYVRSREAVRIFVEHGAYINVKSNNGETPLHTAYNAEVADELIKHGADRTIRTNAGLLPIDEAKRHKRYDVVTVLNAKQIPDR